MKPRVTSLLIILMAVFFLSAAEAREATRPNFDIGTHKSTPKGCPDKQTTEKCEKTYPRQLSKMMAPSYVMNSEADSDLAKAAFNYAKGPCACLFKGPSVSDQRKLERGFMLKDALRLRADYASEEMGKKLKAYR